MELKRPELEIDHLPPSCVDGKNEWICTSAPPIFLHGVDRETLSFHVTGRWIRLTVCRCEMTEASKMRGRYEKCTQNFSRKLKQITSSLDVNEMITLKHILQKYCKRM